MFNSQRVPPKPADFRKFIATAFVIVTGFVSVGIMAAQFTTAPVQLSTSGVNIFFLGWATALSANGQVALVGGGGCQSTAAPAGAFVYTRTNGAWGNPVQLSETGVPTTNSFGCAVALSANGQVALVGSSLSNTAYVFTETNGTWSAPVKLSLNGITPSEFGFSVALSPDGKTALVGDNGANSGAGAVYVYTYGSTWSTGTSLTPTGLSSAQYDYSIAVSSNGNTGLVALIGAVQIGKAYVSTYNGSSWSTPTAISTAGITNTSGSFGASVALSANGQSAVVGSPFENGAVGAAYVYTGTAGSFGSPTALAFPANTTVRGYSVAMAPNGQEVFAGAPLGSTSSTNMGSICAYTYNGSSWSSPVTLSTKGFQSQGGTGWAMAEGASGQEILVGAPEANASAGLGYIYESPTAVTTAVTPNPSAVAPGKNVELDITFTNADTTAGGLPAVNLSGLVLTDTLPAGSSYMSSDAANGSCSHTATTVTCTLASLNAGSNSQNPWQPSITITTPSTPGKISNNVTFLADEPLTGMSSLTTSVTNDVAPTVTSGNITTPAGTAVSGTLQATPGFSGQALTFTIVTQPSHGTVTLTNANTGAFTYTPASGYTGNDTFIFTTGDGTVTSAPGSETIAVGTGGSTSSGKSGGGAIGFPTLLMLSVLLAVMLLRKRFAHTNMKYNTHFQHHRFLIASCLMLTDVLSAPAFAAVLSGAPVALSINNVSTGGLLGWSLAVSANGQVAAGGAPSTNRSGTSGTDYTGVAYVYQLTAGTWSDAITLSTTGIAAGGQIGEAIAVSPNGQQVFVGAPDLNTYTGSVFVYTQTNGSWANTPTRTTLTFPTGVTTDYSFGFALAVSSDGQTLIVGASHAAAGGTSPGGLYAYTLSGSTWGSPVALPMGTIANGAHVGETVAVSSDGTVVIAGATGSNKTYVWTNTGGTWSNPVALTTPTGSSGFGLSVALSGDGTVAMVGAPYTNSSAGAAYVYTNSGGWSTTPVTLSITTVSPYSFGYSVALSPDGKSAFGGAPGAGNAGGVYMSTKSGSTWSIPVALSTSNVEPGANLGITLAQGDSGEALVTAGEDANADTGGLWVYDSPAAITLTASPSAQTVAPGSSLTFNLTLTNADQPGSTPATTLNNVVLTDTLPTGTTYVSSNAANGTCTDAGSTVTCTLASLAPGNNSQNPWSPSITVTTPSSASVLTNTLNVGSNEQLLGSTSVTTKVTNDVVPTAIDGGVATSPGQAVPGTLTVTPGYNGQKLTFVIQGQPTHGTVTLTNAATGAFTYTPTAGFTGTDVFIFNAGDGVVTSNAAAETVTVSTTQVVPPVANDQTLTGVEGYVLNGQLSATSSNGHALIYAATGLPAHGSLKVTNSTGAFTYTPATGFTGNDSFTFNANDGTSTSNTATVSITVLANPSGSSGGSGSSGKSGGGALGFPTLLMLSVLLAMMLLRKRAAHIQLHRILITSCIMLTGVFFTPAFATVLSSVPIQLSDYGLQQDELLGWSLALSSDGQVAAGGAPAYNRSGTNGTDYTGAAYVYVRTGGTWSSPITLSTTGIPTSSFIGAAIAVSPNGQQVIVGAQDATSQGGVYLYNETGGSWTNTPTRTALTLPTSMVGSYFGEGLAVSSNGQTLLVGTRPVNGSSTGEIYAYTLSGSTWTNPVALPVTGIPNGEDAGGILAVSANGQVVVAGVPQQNSAQGAVWVWTQNSNGTWKNPVALILPSTLDSSLAFFGGAVALSADGTEILAGATGANNQVGAAYVYTDTNGTWSGTPKMLSTTLAGVNSFGSSVALSPDGQTAFIGMPVNDTGYVFMSTKTNGTWSTPVSLSLANLPVNAFLGIHLAQADNGEELLTTGYSVNNDTGALFVYDSPAAIMLAASPSAPAVAPGSSLTFNLTLTNAGQPASTPATTLNDVVLTDTLPTGTTYVSSDAANGICTDSGSTVTCTLSSLAPGNNSQNPWVPSITVKTQSSAANLTNTLNVSSNEPLVGSTSVTTKVTNDVVPTIKSGNVSTATSEAVSGTLNATPGFPGQALTFTVVSQPSNGNVTLTNASTGAFTYTPNSGFSGVDTFVWTAGDGFVTATPVAESITVGASGSGSSESSGKSGGAMNLGTLLLFSGFLGLISRRKQPRQI